MADYSPREERLNIGTHALGAVLSLGALVALIMQALTYGEVMTGIAFTVFGLSLLVLYSASTLYHSATDPKRRSRLKVFDHAAIYVLIAGTYTPFSLVTLRGATGWWIFGIVWGCAMVGIILKLFFTGRFKLVSTIMYVAMGWIIVFAIGPLMNSMPGPGLTWLLAGGIAYTVGAVLYSIKRIPYNHAIFHVFVLAGSFCHFVTIYQYVAP